MTQQEAKEITLEVWRYLKDHPWISEKKNLPKKLYAKIKDLYCRCPLCLEDEGYFCCGYYWVWVFAPTNKEREKAAAKIVELVEAWEPEEEE